MAQGYTVNKTSMAIRIGELRSLTASVDAAAGALAVSGGDLGPGGIGASVQKLADQWQKGLTKMTEQIDTMAENVAQVVDNYQAVEDAAAGRFAIKYGVS